MSYYTGPDRLFQNEFIRNEYGEVPADTVSDYKKYRERKKLEEEKRLKIETARHLNERQISDQRFGNQHHSGMSTGAIQQYQQPVNVPKPISGRWVEMKRKIYIDSQHRNKILYPDSADFVVTWGKVFQNVKNMKLVSLEFPNVIQTINGHNNAVFHVNLEDNELDTPFPVYSTFVNPGSYNLSSIQRQLTEQLKSQKRRSGYPDAEGRPAIRHLFIVNVSQETDEISFTSIIPQSTATNPVLTTNGSSRILFTQKDHGYKNRERVHIIGIAGLIGGLSGSEINGSYYITKVSEDQFSFEIAGTATNTASGGGTLVKTGREAPFQFMFGSHANGIADILGFPMENSSESVFGSNPITSYTKLITGCDTPPTHTVIHSPEHRLRVGDRIFLYNFEVTPSIYEDERSRGAFTITHVPSPDTFVIPHVIDHVSNIEYAYIGTQTFSMYFPGHGFNRITSIDQTGPNLVQITTLLDHNFTDKSTVRLTGTDCIPSIDGFYKVQPLTSDTFAVSREDLDNPLVIEEPGHQGILTADQTFFLYNVTPLGGFTSAELNNVPFKVREIIDDSTFTFTGHYGFSSHDEVGGGTPRINSRLHGWRGTQTNYFGGKLFKPVALAGANYCFLTIPGLNSDSIASSGPVRNIFAKCLITALPGTVIFDRFDSSLIDFAVPIATMSELRLVFKDANNYDVSFNGLDYSLGLELTEMVRIL